MLATDVSSLQRISMFKDVDASKLKLIALTSQRTNYRIGDCLFKEGGRADTVFIILEGTANVLRHNGSSDVQIAVLERGAVVGELGVVLDRPYTGTVIAETALTALCIDKRTFLDLLTQIPQISMAVIRELAHRVVETSNLYVKALAK